ncbi:MAG: hypothetical protein LBG81_00520 [Coriobacteriaceae bacterium]|nr:hypothetical protein [Coriobacteriaceae bacterium]
MGKPSIGTAVTPAQETEKEQTITELTVLQSDAKDSIFNLVFADEKSGKPNNDEQ